MTVTSINDPVLVFNKGWVPIHIKSMKDAICDVVAECAEIIETEQEVLDENGQVVSAYCQTHNWASWASLPIPPGKNVIHGVRMNVRVPEIIRLVDYDDVPEIEIRLTRRNLLLRDNFRCQYCGNKVTSSTFTIDHVVPRSRGGPNSWENFVVACFPCNIKKRDRTPKEAGVVLRSKPVKPHWYPLATRFNQNSPPSWKKWLPDSKIPALT